MPGIEPGAFHMQSERATTALHPLLRNIRPQNLINIKLSPSSLPIIRFSLHTTKFAWRIQNSIFFSFLNPTYLAHLLFSSSVSRQWILFKDRIKILVHDYEYIYIILYYNAVQMLTNGVTLNPPAIKTPWYKFA